MLKKIILSSMLLVLGTCFAWSQQVAIIAPYSTTPCTGTTFSYVPVTGGSNVVPASTTYSWPAPIVTGNIIGGVAGLNATSISGTLALSPTTITSQTATATYTVTPTSPGGVGNPFTVTVSVKPYATAANITTGDTTVCGNLNIVLTGSATSDILQPVFSWYTNSDVTNGFVYSGSVFTTPKLQNNTSYYLSVSGTNVCPNLANTGKKVAITVTATAPDVVLPANASQLVCAGLSPTTDIIFISAVSGPTTVYNWTNNTTAIGLAASGTGTINSFTTINTTNAPLVATIAVTPFIVYTSTNVSCNGATQSFSIVVDAVPSVTGPINLSMCSGNTLGYTASGVPSNTTYSWFANSIPTGIVVQAGPGTGSSFNPTIYNTTNSPIDISFTVTPRSARASCPGNSFTIKVTVNPTPSIVNQAVNTCSGTAFAVSPTNDINNIVPAGITYTWLSQPQVVSGILSGYTAQATPQTFISQTLTNVGSVNAVIKYNVTPAVTTAGCIGTPFSVTVTVYPKPVLSNTILNSTICNNVLYNFVPASAVSGVNFAWARTAGSNISNPNATGIGSINDTLSNIGNNNEVVTYQYTLTANGCSSSQSLLITVKPTLVINSGLIASTCSGSPYTTQLNSATTGTTISWTRTAVSGISNSTNAATSFNINETLIDTTNFPIIVRYQLRNTSISTTVCSDTTSLVLTVYPLPTVNTIPDQVICSGAGATIAFTGSGVANTVYSWTNNNANIGPNNGGDGDMIFNATNSTYLPIRGNITVIPNASGCNGTAKSFVITVNPTPILSSDITIAAICSKTPVVYTPASQVPNTVFTWARGTIVGIDNAAATGAGNLQDTLSNSSNIPLQVPYNYTMTAAGCSSSQLVTVTVNPVPTMFNPGDQLACNNSTKVINFSGSIVSGTSYLWTNDNTQIGVPALGTGDIFFVANSTSTDSVFAHIVATPQAYNCSGPSVSFTIVINPPLVLTSSTTPAAVCSNSLFGYTPSSTGTNSIYIWNRQAVSGISNAPSTGSGSIQEILVNTTSAPITVGYQYTISSNSCITNQTVSVVVNPALVLNNLNVANEVCSASSFDFSPSGNITGVPYLWSRDIVTGISNAAATGSGDIHEVLTNTTNSPISVLYKYSLGLGSGCAIDQVVSVTVKPVPYLTSSQAIAACSNTPVAYTPIGNIPGTNFNWSRAVVAGISNTASIGLVGISESLINNTTSTVTATYVYSLTNYNGCSNIQNVTVQVKPGPIAFPSTDQSICADDITQPIVFTSNLPNTTYSWTNSEPGIGLAASGTTSTIPSFKSVNTTSGQLVAIIQVVPITNGCTGSTITVERITVNRAITTSFIETLPTIACPNQPVGPFIASIPLGGDGSTYIFQWQVSTDSINFTNIPGGTSRQLVAPAITQNSFYRMTTVSLGCSAVTPVAKVVLKPKPTITVTNRDNYTISKGNSTQLVATGALTYLWTPPTNISNFTDSMPFVSPLVDTKYTVLGTTADGCSDSTSVNIIVILGYQITPNNILTPNGDGINDTWKIKNIEYYPDNHVKIYNINGTLVRHFDGYTQNQWAGEGDGGVNAGKLATGTYYYVITLGTAAEAVIKGWILILN
jgi:gliding motility-associated-like protein